MEPLLFILFVLFSLVSAILERRKRRKELERQAETQVRRPRLDQDDAEREREDEDEDWSGKVSDPFELAESDKRTGPLHSAEAEEIEHFEQELQRREEEEKQMRLARASAERAERRAAQIETQINDIQQRRHIEELVSERLEHEQHQILPPLGDLKRRSGRGRFSPAEARKAIIYAEIFGKPKAEREEGF